MRVNAFKRKDPSPLPSPIRMGEGDQFWHQRKDTSREYIELNQPEGDISPFAI